MSERAALLSVRPRFADALLDGTKTIEIRRRGARLKPDALCLLYSSAPVRALVGAVEIVAVHVGPAEELWADWGERTALSRREFDEYLQGSRQPCAIAVGSAVRFDSPIPLAQLRERHSAFVVPQSYRFVKPGELPALVSGIAKAIRVAALSAPEFSQLRLAA